MSLTYTTYQASIANLMGASTTQPNFQTMLPNMIADAELRIQRDLDFLQTMVIDSSVTLVPLSRAFFLPVTPSTTFTGQFVVVKEINVYTPAGTTSPVAATRVLLLPSSQHLVEALWPSSAGAGVPKYYAMFSQSIAILGPWPDNAYQIEVVGTQRFQPLSATTATTFISTYLDDLFVAASMVFASGFMKNYGMRSDDPQQPVNWEAHYKALLASAAIEEARKKYTSAGWSYAQPAPTVTPPRT